MSESGRKPKLNGKGYSQHRNGWRSIITNPITRKRMWKFFKTEQESINQRQEWMKEFYPEE